MAQASGYAVLPVMPSMSGFGAALQKQIVGPATKAGKDAGDSIGKGMQSGVQSAQKAVDGALYRVKKSTEEQQAAESKLAEQKLKVEAANKAVESAARKREDAESKGIDAIERAEETLLKKRAAAEKASRDLASAESKVEDSLTESARAAKNLEQKQAELNEAQKDGGKHANDLSKSYEDLGDHASGVGAKLKDMAGKLGALAGVAGAGAFAGLGADLQKETDLINLQLGYTDAAAAGVGESIREALKSGVAGSAEDAANAIGSLESQFKYLGSEGEQTAGELSDNFLAFSKVFDVSLPEATQTAGQLITNNLATDVENAADLMTTAMQRVPKEMQGELPEIINEYGVNFQNLGFSGEQAFSLLVNQAGKGKWALDKTGDALKEFTIRATDGSKSTAGAYEAIGEDAEAMAQSVTQGGESAQLALKYTAQSLLDMEDPAERAQQAIALFGTPLEDIGIDQIPTFLEGLVQGEDSMAGFAGSSQAAADTIANSLQGRMDKLKGTVQAVAGDAFMKLWDVVQQKVIPALQDAGEWVQKNQAWIAPLAAAIAGAAGAWALWTGAIKAWQIATKIATGIQFAFNAVVNANPIMRGIAIFTAITAALVVFFTKTETGRKIWAKFTESLAKGWDWVKDKFTAGWEWMRDQVFNPLMSFVTETLWPKIQAAWDGIKQGWDIFVGALQSTWQNVLKPVFDGIWKVVQVTLGVIGTLILAPLILAWNVWSTAISWAWENVIQPVWQAIADFAQNTLGPVVQNVIQWIGDKWNWVKDTFTAGWNWVRDNVFQPLIDFAMSVLWPVIQGVIDQIVNAWNFWRDVFTTGWNWVRDNVFQPLVNFATQVLWPNIMNVVQWIVDKWNWMRDLLGAAWAWIRDNVIQLFINGANNLWDMVSRAIGFIVDKWNWLKDKLNEGWQWIDNNVFSSFKSGLQKIEDFFGSVVGGIRSTWDSLKSALAKPINFMINTVYNDGILKAWNVIAGILPGLEKGSSLAGIPEHATGGAIRGPGTGTSDDVLMWGSNGEHMWTAKEVSEVGGQGAMYAMRKAVQSGLPFTFDGKGGVAILPRTNERAGDLAGMAPGLLLPAFKDGGEIRPMWEMQLERGHAWAQSRSGRPYVLGGSADGGGGTDCSGFMSGIADVIQGGTGARQWATMAFNGGGNSQMPSGPQGFVAGLGPYFSIGVTNGGAAGGHTAGTLGAVGGRPATNVESGGSHGNVAYGGPAVGADDGYFTTHYNLPIGPDGAFVSGGGGGMDPGVMRATISAKLGEVIDKVMDPIVSKLPSPPPSWQGIPKGVYDSGRDGLTEGIAKGVEGLTDGLATVWSALRKIPDLLSGKLSDADDVNEAALYDKGGVWKSGTLGINKSGADEYVFTNRSMRSFEDATKNLQVAADAFMVAFDSASLNAAAAKSTNTYVTDQAKGVLDIFGLGSVATTAGSWWDKNGEQVTADALALYGATQNPDSAATVSGFGQSATFEFNAESLDDVVRVGDLTSALEQVGVRTNVRKKPTAVLTRGGAM